MFCSAVRYLVAYTPVFIPTASPHGRRQSPLANVVFPNSETFLLCLFCFALHCFAALCCSGLHCYSKGTVPPSAAVATLSKLRPFVLCDSVLLCSVPLCFRASWLCLTLYCSVYTSTSKTLSPLSQAEFRKTDPFIVFLFWSALL